MKKLPFLRPGDQIICAYAKAVSGPGWANEPLWVIIRGADNVLRDECIQPDERPPGIDQIYDISASVHRALIWALEGRME